MDTSTYLINQIPLRKRIRLLEGIIFHSRIKNWDWRGSKDGSLVHPSPTVTPK